MWFWLQISIIILIIWILIEEGIYFFVNRSIFGPSLLERKWKSFLDWGKKKIKKEAS